MFTHKDIENRSLFVLNGTEHQRLKVSNGRFHLENTQTQKAITVLPFPKILAVLVIGHTTLTTPFIEHCNKYGIPVVVMKPNFRPIFYFGNMAEANFLLRKKQYDYYNGHLGIAKILIKNKIKNQLVLLNKTLEKSSVISLAKEHALNGYQAIEYADDYRKIMGIEGNVAKYFFKAYFDFAEWNERLPRIKSDNINSTLDIGYTMLFNYIESMTRLFGFDPYVGIYHQLWFRRKGLICDLIEPFRCIIDHQIRKSIKYGTFKKADFQIVKNAYILKPECRQNYNKVFFTAIIERKLLIYKYIQQYYRCFMGKKSVVTYPVFNYE